MLSLLKKGLKKQNFDSAHRKEVLSISLIGDYLKIVLYFKFSHLLYIESSYYFHGWIRRVKCLYTDG